MTVEPTTVVIPRSGGDPRQHGQTAAPARRFDAGRRPIACTSGLAALRPEMTVPSPFANVVSL
jgi:hypothetical protein